MVKENAEEKIKDDSPSKAYAVAVCEDGVAEVLVKRVPEGASATDACFLR